MEERVTAADCPEAVCHLDTDLLKKISVEYFYVTIGICTGVCVKSSKLPFLTRPAGGS